MDRRDDAWIDAVARGAFGADPPAGSPDTPEAPEAPEGVDPGRLMDWRAGALPEADAARVEAALADDPEARAMLRELAEPVPPFVAAWGRREARRALGGRRRWIGPAVGLALAAAVALFVFVPRGPTAPEYRIEAVRGTRAPIRGDEAPPRTGGVVDPESVLVVALAPDGDAPGQATARGFAEAADGRLRALPPATIRVGQGGALRFEAPVAEVFGRAFGRRTLWLAVGATADALEAQDGQHLDDARRTPGTTWLSVEVEYREGVP